MVTIMATSTGVFILLLYLQNAIAQQCLNHVGFKNSPGLPQQNFQKSSCGLNKIAQNGLNYPQHGNIQQVNYQQQQNNQQATALPARNSPLVNSQGNLQQPINAMSNSQFLKEPNQDMATNAFSTLLNSIKQSAQNQRDARNIVQGNLHQSMNYEHLSPSQIQANSINTVTASNNPQNNQYSVCNSYSEYPQVQSGFNFQFVPNDNIALQPNQQMFALPVHKVSTNDQNQSYAVQSQPTTNSHTSQQAAIQSPIVMIPDAQTNTVQNQPTILALQSTSSKPQLASIQNQPILSTSQNQPIIYTVQTQPSTVSNQNLLRLEVPSQKQGMNNPTMDKQSLISYVMSQMQNSQGNGNMLASLLPGVLNTRSEKFSMKTLLPLIFNILNEKNNCCGCPHCGCRNGNNEQIRPEPIVNTGYSNQINYSQQKLDRDLSKNTEYVEKRIDSNNNFTKQENPKAGDVNQKSVETSGEEDEGNGSEEEYDEE